MKHKCLLCENKPIYVCFFYPHNAQEFGAPSGKSRVIAYHLCKTCAKRKAVGDEVEQHILRDMKKQPQQSSN